MLQMEYTPNGVNLAGGETAAACAAAVELCPTGYKFTGYVNFAHGGTTNHRTWWATYQSRKGRSKRLAVLEVVPAQR